ncbi:S8 family peptidase [Bacillus sp. 165]|uniref:S8 family peptidase n=1 Tax=Bacillus sp. 165 TaxID=1529117 RepID=UPI001AD9E002|nr:S8 family peptidase [Bacillus sp. 165]MBO9129138.1 peptidase S8 [Bacillus sp. 165]
MFKKIIIGAILLLFVFTIVSSIRPKQQALPKQTQDNINEMAVEQSQISNLQTRGPEIKAYDMIKIGDKLEAKLNHSSSIKLIDHNGKEKSHYYTDKVIVHFKDPLNKQEMAQVIREIDGKLIQSMDSTYVFKSSSKSATEMTEYFKKKDSVEFAEPEFLLMQNEVNDELYNKYQWNLPAIETEAGWNITRGAKNVKIAVIDSGVDLNHPDLARRLTNGYNAISKNNNANDDNGHGSHVAGIIASETNNRTGIAGITWYNPIIPVKVLNSEGVGSAFDIAEGIRWAVDNGANVINLSLGNYQPSAVMEEAINYAFGKDVVIIVAAGNDNSGQPSYPAAYPEVLSVSAVGWDKNRASFSNYGEHIDVAAPGVDIASTYVNGQYASLSGTSMAAPHVTALAGLIRSVNPSLKNTEVMDIITRTTMEAGQPGHDPYYGSGVIDIVKALELASAHK